MVSNNPNENILSAFRKVASETSDLAAPAEAVSGCSCRHDALISGKCSARPSVLPCRKLDQVEVSSETLRDCWWRYQSSVKEAERKWLSQTVTQPACCLTGPSLLQTYHRREPEPLNFHQSTSFLSLWPLSLSVPCPVLSDTSDPVTPPFCGETMGIWMLSGSDLSPLQLWAVPKEGQPQELTWQQHRKMKKHGCQWSKSHWIHPRMLFKTFHFSLLDMWAELPLHLHVTTESETGLMLVSTVFSAT